MSETLPDAGDAVGVGVVGAIIIDGVIGRLREKKILHHDYFRTILEET